MSKISKKTNGWQKYITRHDVDLLTTSGIDIAFFNALEQFLKSKKEALFTYYENGKFVHYIKGSPYKFGLYLYKKHFNSANKIKKYYKFYNNWWRQEQKVISYWRGKLKNFKNNELLRKAYADFLKSFRIINYYFSVCPYIAIDAWQKDMDNVLNNLILKNEHYGRKDIIISSVYRPWKKPAVSEIQDKIRRGVSLAKILKDYEFLGSWSIVWHEPINYAWLKSLGVLKGGNIENNYLNFGRIIKILKPTGREKNFIKIAPHLIFLKDWRDDVRRKYAYMWNFLFREIAGQYQIKYKDLGYFSFMELGNCLKNKKFDLKIIKRRKNNPCVLVKQKSASAVAVIEGIKFERYNKIIKDIDNKSESSFIKGFIAQPGVAQGKARIIQKYNDIKRVRKGDILVAVTTHPNYLPAMKKAAAFITNEGGIMSHAAIVARELGKPSIVGTKNATKILHDGDLVEIDADKGIIKILK